MDSESKLITDQEVRQKLIARGVGSLTNAELMSIVLRNGVGGESAIESATAILDEYDASIVKIARCELNSLRQCHGMGASQAAILLSALELGRRCRADETFMKETIESNLDVVDMFQPLLSDLPYEEFWAIYMSVSYRVLDKIRVSQGGVGTTVVDHRIIVKRAVEKLADGIILIHNHPSGNPTPSETDITLTEQLIKAASLFNITVADHVIITSGECYSFRNNGFFDDKE